MQLRAEGIEVALEGWPRLTAELRGGSPFRLGPVEVAVPEAKLPGIAGWSIANRSDEPVRVRSVSLVFRVESAPAAPLRMLRNGYQSWTPSGVATFGIDTDPSRAPGSFELVRAAHHADQAVAAPGELRSEWVTVVEGADGRVLVGFAGGNTHDGTLRLRPAGPSGPAGPEAGSAPQLLAEAFLGGARLNPGEERALHRLIVLGDGTADARAADLLAGWAAEVGRLGRARTGAPFQVGWCSWYQYFHDVSERDLKANLALATDWPFDVFQLDDGYQAAIGDWLETNDRFPTPIDGIAAAITAAGRSPGIWIAPFIVAPDSEVATMHPDWLAHRSNGEPLPGILNPAWGGGRGGLMWTLDTTHPEVRGHLRDVGAALVEAGYEYVKLDFTYAPSFDGRWFDDSMTPAERVRAGYGAVRAGAGEETFILGCGVPLSNVVGLVDGCRIGPDVAPTWDGQPGPAVMSGYEGSMPATRHALRNTFVRSFLHRQVWLNDPDCVMLRRSGTSMSAEAVEGWARAVGVSGGMVLVSDDLSLLDAQAAALLDEVVAMGRASDAAAIAGSPAICSDVMDQPEPTRLETGRLHLRIDPASGRSAPPS
jgi:alpha-galactosidase